MEEFFQRNLEEITRRYFLKECVTGLGAMAMGSLAVGCNPFSKQEALDLSKNPLLPKAPHFIPKAKSNDIAATATCASPSPAC